MVIYALGSFKFDVQNRTIALVEFVNNTFEVILVLHCLNIQSFLWNNSVETAPVTYIERL